jgi:LacI family transcriptional regulator
VLNGQGYVSDAARQRVETAAEQLGYRPSALGRGLKSQRTHNLGLIVADISNNFYGEFAEGVLAEAQTMGMHVIVCASGENEDSEREYIDVLIEQRVEGIVAFPTGTNTDRWRIAEKQGIPVVFADRTVPGLDFPAVVVDNAAGTRRLTEYLLALGHRRIGFLGGPASLSTAAEREAGFYQAHAEYQLPVRPELVVRGRFTRDTAYASALRLLDQRVRPSALVAANNVLGEAALGAIRDHGLTVPDDVSMVMFDDVPWASLIRPAITVIAQPAHAMGRAAARLATAGPSDRPSTQTVLTEMIIRDSARPWHEATGAGAKVSRSH